MVTSTPEGMGDQTRIDSGRLVLDPAPVHLSDVVCRIARLLDSEGQRVHFVFEEVPTVMADGEQLAQVVTNLLRNAVDYSPPEKPVEVEVAGRCLAREPGRLVVVNGSSRSDVPHECRPAVSVAVRDSGAGMTPEELQRVFQPISRTEGSLGLLRDGSGLAKAKAIIEGHCGRLWAQSRPGQGSVFGFCLPASPAAAADGAA